MSLRVKQLPKRASEIAKKDLILLQEGGAKLVETQAKTELFSQGEAADHLFYVLQGKVQISVLSKQGREGMIGLLSKGDFVGEASLTGQVSYLESAKAFTDCRALKIPAVLMHDLIRKSPTLSEYFTHFLLQHTIDVQADLIDHLFNSSEKRLARVLLPLANFRNSGKLEPIPPISQELLAERVGTTRSRINFFMNKFRRLGLIDYNGHITVHSGLMNVVLSDTRISDEGEGEGEDVQIAPTPVHTAKAR